MHYIPRLLDVICKENKQIKNAVIQLSFLNDKVFPSTFVSAYFQRIQIPNFGQFLAQSYSGFRRLAIYRKFNVLLFFPTLRFHILKCCMLKKLTILFTLSALFINFVWQYKIQCNFRNVLNCIRFKCVQLIIIIIVIYAILMFLMPLF